jgi:glutathione synthase/RimK-type ligase-like ATP-grasp enzyme
MSLIVALIISEKKRATLEANHIFAFPSDVKYVFPKHPSDLSVQPDLLISKLSDVDDEWEKVIDKQLNHIPHVTPISAQRVVQDRWLTFQQLDKSGVDVPETVLIGSLDPIPEHLRYPMMLKTQIACGPVGSHLMMIAESKGDVEKYRSDEAIRSVGDFIIAQQFVPHKKFYKIFVIGDNVFVYEREVRGDMVSGEVFEPKTYATMGIGREAIASEDSPFFLIAQRIQSAFELNLFGIDVIKSDKKLYVIDVNYFPTYKELGGTEFRNQLDQFCRSLVR